MTEDPFEGCWDRISRAQAHHEAAIAEWNAYLGREPYTSRLIVQDDGNATLWIEEFEPFPSLIPILIGEWVYNLRAALDYCAYAVAICDTGQDPPPRADVIQFPIYATEDAFQNNAYRLEPLREKHREWFESVQPYNGGYGARGTALYWVNELARLDRHRRLHVVGMTPAEAWPLVNAPKADSVLFEDVEPEFVEGEAVVARFQVIPFSRGDQVEANPNMWFDVEIKEMAQGRPPEARWLSFPMARRLRIFEALIDSYIGRFERDCLGYTRAKFLADETEIERPSETHLDDLESEEEESAMERATWRLDVLVPEGHDVMEEPPPGQPLTGEPELNPLLERLRETLEGDFRWEEPVVRSQRTEEGHQRLSIWITTDAPDAQRVAGVEVFEVVRTMIPGVWLGGVVEGPA